MADILKPNILWIKGRCYRLYGQNAAVGSSTLDTCGYGDDDREFENDNSGWGDDLSDDDFELETTNNGKIRSAFHVPRSLHAVLIGFKGAAKQRLEKETKTQICIPRKGMDEDIIVTAQSKDCVVQARRRMELIILAARQKQPFTHFLSIPMCEDAIKRGFLQFKDQVLAECSGRGVGPDIFQEPSKLHLTLGTLSLLDDVDRKRAAQALLDCRRDVIEPLLANRTLRLQMRGIEYMNDDPSEVDVLYGCVEDLSEPPIIQELADGIVRYIAKTGLMPKQFEAVKLHVTLMNSIFRQSEGDSELVQTGKGNGRKPRESFNAAPILEKMKNFNFGEMVVKSIDLSRRYSTAVNGYYEATATVALEA